MKIEKKCSCCKKTKLIIEFNKNGKWWSGKCKPCQYVYNSKKSKIYIKNNREKYKEYQKKSSKKCYNRGQMFINKHRALCGCLKCGEKRYWIIDYHHLDPSTKDHPIPWYKTSKIETLKIELRKCIPLCRNCHTDFHFQEKLNKITIQQYLK